MGRDFLLAAILMYRCAGLEELDTEKDLDTFTYKCMFLYCGDQLIIQYFTSMCTHVISKHVQCRLHVHIVSLSVYVIHVQL